MNIIISQLLNDEILKSLGISVEQIIDTVKIPQYSEFYELDSIQLYFNLNKYDDYGVLTLIQIDGENIIIHFALRIKQELLTINNNPLIILQQAINSYGLSFRIGNQFNKFIFREKVDIDPDGIAQLVEVFNPNNHRFIQTFLIYPDSEKLTVDCALAFCLDIDDYIYNMGLTNSKSVILISPSIKGYTHNDLITSIGTFTGVINKNTLGTGKYKELFHVIYEDYSFEAGLHENSMYIIRNGMELSYEFYWASDSKGFIKFFLMWQPEKN